MTRQRLGFTMIELVVVAAIVAVLMAMLLPAVQRVREAANAAMCISNLRQIGMAVGAYYDANRAFPRSDYRTSLGTHIQVELVAKNQLFWSLLPYMEGGVDVTAVNAVAVPILLCPSRRGTSVGTKTDYGLPMGEGSVLRQKIGGPLVLGGGSEVDGISDWGIDRLTRVHVSSRGGLSNTFMLSHKGLELRRYSDRHDNVPVDPDDPMLPWDGPMFAGYGRCAFFVLRDSNAPFTLTTVGEYNVNLSTPATVTYEGRNWVMGGPHVSVPYLFADGSVRLLRYTHDASVTEAHVEFPVAVTPGTGLNWLNSLGPHARVIWNCWSYTKNEKHDDTNLEPLTH